MWGCTPKSIELVEIGGIQLLFRLEYASCSIKDIGHVWIVSCLSKKPELSIRNLSQACIFGDRGSNGVFTSDYHGDLPETKTGPEHKTQSPV